MWKWLQLNPLKRAPIKEVANKPL